MKHQIHINDQGELLLIEVPDKPKSPSALAPLVVWGYYDKVSFPSYQAALTSAIEKGIRFRDQKFIAHLLVNPSFDFKSMSLDRGYSPEIALIKNTLYDLPNSYTAEVKWYNPCIEHKKCLIADEKNHNNCAQLHGNVCQKLHQVAVLTPLKQEPKKKATELNSFGDDVLDHFDTLTREPGNEAKKESWISVEDQLPENDTWVIAYSKSAFRYSGQMVVLYSDETFYGHGIPLAKSEVTHWQPTLTPPLKPLK